jgi:GTP 3',8-cyclase
MFDQFKRRINYLRISVTDRCNLRCTYCMPECGVELLQHADILRFEEIVEVVRTGVAMGIDKVRLTGGEPLVRRGIVNLVKMLAEIDGIVDLSLTTNGILLAEMAGDLKNAGLNRVNISLDTTNPETYNQITRGGDIQAVFRGIDAALNAGLWPVKLNCVIRKSRNETDAMLVRDYAAQKGLEVRYIHVMNLGEGEFSRVEGGDGGHCSTCNRLRLTADGFLMPCLFNQLSYNVRSLGAGEAFRQALQHKPKCGSTNKTGQFFNIGG